MARAPSLRRMRSSPNASSGSAAMWRRSSSTSQRNGARKRGRGLRGRRRGYRRRGARRRRICEALAERRLRQILVRPSRVPPAARVAAHLARQSSAAAPVTGRYNPGSSPSLERRRLSAAFASPPRLRRRLPASPDGPPRVRRRSPASSESPPHVWRLASASSEDPPPRRGPSPAS